jgi:NADH-quinone oxidoreductase subunit G
MRPDIGPLGRKVMNPGKNPEQVLQEGSTSGWDYLHVAGADPACSYPAHLWGIFRAKLGFLVVQDLFLTATAMQADVVLPTLSFVEKEGSFVNVEGRIQPLLPGRAIPEALRSDSDIFVEIGKKLQIELTLDSEFADLLSQRKVPLRKIPKIENAESPVFIEQGEFLRASFAVSLFDNGVRMQHNPHLIQMTKEPAIRIHPQEAEKLNINNQEQALLTFRNSTIQVLIQTDRKIAKGTVVIPLGFGMKCPIRQFGVNLLNGLPIRIEPINASGS